MSVRRSLIVLAILALALPVIVSVVSANQAATEQAQRQQAVANLERYTVEPGRVELSVSARGGIASEEVSDLSLTMGGQIASVYVAEGDYVLAGEPLVMLANETEQISYTRAIINLEIAHLRFQDTREVDEDDVRVAEAQVQAARAAYQAVDDRVTEDNIRAAELRYQQAQEALIAAEQARRVASIDENGLALLDAQIGEASFNLEIARLELEELRRSNQGELGASYATILQAEQRLAQVQAGADEFALEERRINIEDALTSVQQAEKDFYDTILVAPFDGVVSELNVEVGQVVNASEPLVQLTDITPLRMEGQVDEVDISQVTEGMIAHVEIDPLDDRVIRGEVTDIAPRGRSVNGIVNYDVDIALSEEDADVRAGMTAEAFIVVESRENVLVVPNVYIRRDGRGSSTGFVSTLNPDGTLREIEVTLGLRGDDVTEIQSGLSEGDLIVRDLSAIDNTTSFFE
jgi:HlyD family secretion protein